MSNAALNICTQVCVWTYAFILLGRYVGIAGSHGNSMFNLWKNCQTVFLMWQYHFTFPAAMNEGCSFFTDSLTPTIASLFDKNHFSRYVVVSHCGFHLHFPKANGMEYLFMSLFIIHVVSSGKSLFKSLAHLKSMGCLSSYNWVMSYLHVLIQVL